MIKGKKRVDPKWFAIKAIWLSIVMLVVFKWAFGSFANHYSFLYDAQPIRCIPEYKAYFLKKNQPITKGAIYAFRAKGLMPFFPDGARLGKYVIAVGGDHVEINENGVFVNGELKTTGFVLANKLGKKPESFYKTFAMPEGKAFFVGTAPRSYDSRYWGLVDFNQIIGKAIPIW